MFAITSRSAWVLTLRGILAIVLGLASFFWPVATLMVLLVAFGVYAIADGVVSLIWSVSRKQGFSVGAFLIGLAGIVAGIIAFAWPAVTAMALMYIIAMWAIIRGFFEFVASIEFRELFRSSWLIALSGAVSVIFGTVMIVWPEAGVLAMLWLIGSYAIIYGVLAIALGVQLRSTPGPADFTRLHPA